MTGLSKHVLLWLAPEFMQSKGVIQILEQAGALGLKSGDASDIMEAATRSGGFAISGVLMDVNHGAGIWISPSETENLQIMIPWGFVRCSVIAEKSKTSKIFALSRTLQETPMDTPPRP